MCVHPTVEEKATLFGPATLTISRRNFTDGTQQSSSIVAYSVHACNHNGLFVRVRGAIVHMELLQGAPQHMTSHLLSCISIRMTHCAQEA